MDKLVKLSAISQVLYPKSHAVKQIIQERYASGEISIHDLHETRESLERAKHWGRDVTIHGMRLNGQDIAFLLKIL